MGTFSNPSLAQIKAFLLRIRTIAVVGISADAFKPSHSVARALQAFGYRIVPVNPSLEQVVGERCWPTIEAAMRGLSDVRIDLVDVFRLPKFVPAIIDDCIRLELGAVWLQDGVIHEEAALRAQHAGLFTVMNRCTYRDRATLVARVNS